MNEQLLEQTLLSHAARYPKMRARDAVKLVYQCALGGGHLIADEKAAIRFVCEEMAACAPSDAPLLERLAGGVCRIHLYAAREAGLTGETLGALFVRSARRARAQDALPRALSVLARLCDAGALPFDGAGMRAYLAAYAAAGYPPERHSEAYRAAYAPAYRVLDTREGAFAPLFAALDRALSQKPYVTLAIDGGSASGKSTLGALIAQIYQADLIHMDDFFLPPARKTPERLQESGGNVDYERFLDEVLAPLARHAPFAYHRYDCQSGLLAPRHAAGRRLTVAEGAYSLHPALRGHYDLRVLLTIPEKTQRARILARNGPALLARFQREWIPLENAYFRAENLAALCDFVFPAEDDG